MLSEEWHCGTVVGCDRRRVAWTGAGVAPGPMSAIGGSVVSSIGGRLAPCVWFVTGSVSCSRLVGRTEVSGTHSNLLDD